MKKNQNSKSGLQNRAEQVSANTVKPDSLPKINWEQRRENRRMDTEKLLELLRTQAPRFWELAEVIGKWVWISFTEKQPREITFALSQLGFHWNNKRQTWQHPCGTLIEEPSLFDPRRKYGSHPAATLKAAA
jgi:hypothetical protein